jgi:hypothetical protein
MDHAAERSLVPALLGLLTVLVNRPYHNIVASVVAVTSSLICETEHLSGLRIEFRMRSERGSLDLPFKIVPTNCFQGHRIHNVRRPVLLGRQQHATPEGNVGICRRADNALHKFVVREWISVPTE